MKFVWGAWSELKEISKFVFFSMLFLHKLVYSYSLQCAEQAEKLKIATKFFLDQICGLLMWTMFCFPNTVDSSQAAVRGLICGRDDDPTVWFNGK